MLRRIVPVGLVRQLIGAAVYSGCIRLAGMLMTFLVGVQLARYLGSEGYGAYGTVMAVVMILAIPAQLGLPQLMTRELSTVAVTGLVGRARAALKWFPVSVGTAACLMMLIAFAILAAWPGEADPLFARTLIWGLASVPLTALITLSIGALRGLHRVVSGQFYDALLRPAVLAMLLFGANAMDTITPAGAMVLQAVASLLVLVVAFVHMRRSIPAAWASVPPRSAPAFWMQTAVPMSASEIMFVINGQYPILLLGVLAPFDEVGVFRVAVAIAALASFTTTLVHLVVMPYLAQFNAAGDFVRLRLLSSAAAVAAFAGTAFTGLLLLVTGKPLLASFFGPEFVPAWQPMMIMTFAVLVNASFGAAPVLLNMCGRSRSLTAALACGPLVGAVVTVGLYPWLRIDAAAVGMVCAELVKGLWMTRAAVRGLGVNPTLGSARVLARFLFRDRLGA
ncbi:MAG: oligosaccharide flippase family protein [Parvibaculaceae bacterium]